MIKGPLKRNDQAVSLFLNVEMGLARKSERFPVRPRSLDFDTLLANITTATQAKNMAGRTAFEAIAQE